MDAPVVIGGPAVDEQAPDVRDPVDRVVADLAVVDRAMARVVRGMAEAGPRDGLSVRRLVGLLAGATGMDVGFLDRAVEVLRPMPLTQAAFDVGLLSWSQVRGIVVEARRLSIAQRAMLDAALAGTIVQARDRGEPDRVVEVAGDLAARLDVVGQERLEAAQERHQGVVLQPGFDGWGDIHGTLAPEVFASTAAALDALADQPVAADAPPATDEDGRVLPAAARPPTSRAAQHAEALGRMAALVLGGTDSTVAAVAAVMVGAVAAVMAVMAGPGAVVMVGSVAAVMAVMAGPVAVVMVVRVEWVAAVMVARLDRSQRWWGWCGLRRARPRVTVIAPLADLVAAQRQWCDSSMVEGVAAGPLDVRLTGLTSRLLLRRGNGRRRLSRALTRALADDADLVALFVDDDGMPVAVGDSFSPISPAMRRVVIARDQGCRAPGCSAPAEHCDCHHVIPREEDGLTEVANLVLMCRACHTRIRAHRWQMTLQADATLHTRIGWRAFITRPRLTVPALPSRDPDRRPSRPDQPVSADGLVGLSRIGPRDARFPV